MASAARQREVGLAKVDDDEELSRLMEDDEYIQVGQIVEKWADDDPPTQVGEAAAAAGKRPIPIPAPSRLTMSATRQSARRAKHMLYEMLFSVADLEAFMATLDGGTANAHKHAPYIRRLVLARCEVEVDLVWLFEEFECSGRHSEVWKDVQKKFPASFKLAPLQSQARALLECRNVQQLKDAGFLTDDLEACFGEPWRRGLRKWEEGLLLLCRRQSDRRQRLTEAMGYSFAPSEDPGETLEAMHTDQYIVEAILDKRLVGRDPGYLIKWEKFPHSWNSWEPKRNMDCQEEIQRFEKALKTIVLSPVPNPAVLSQSHSPTISRSQTRSRSQSLSPSQTQSHPRSRVSSVATTTTSKATTLSRPAAKQQRTATGAISRTPQPAYIPLHMRSSARPSEAPNRPATVASVYASINDIPRLSEANTGIPSAILGVTKFPGDPNYWYLLGFNTMTPKVYWA
ncbi:MAG: hypothetical protein Q8P67_28235, partial [archaeon]|nr:hypothetical protein [archaeon]